MHRAVFLDRDGTLNIDHGFTHRVESLELFPGVIPGLQKLTALGLRLVIVTNQSGIAREVFSEEDMHQFHGALIALLAKRQIKIERIYHCPFHPTEGLGRWRCDSSLRKPKPGMLLQAAADLRLDLQASFSIGDKRSDLLAGQAAGCRNILVETGHAGRDDQSLPLVADAICPDLWQAALTIERWIHER